MPFSSSLLLFYFSLLAPPPTHDCLLKVTHKISLECKNMFINTNCKQIKHLKKIDTHLTENTLRLNFKDKYVTPAQENNSGSF
jgi:hypothetical protein